jgi:hypothetical protein
MKSVLENKLLTLYKKEMILFLKANPQYFEEAVQLALSDKHPYCWRAAFLLFDCIEENDKRMRKHVKSIVECISTKKDGHQRELLKILLLMDLKESYEGKVFNVCMDLWEQIGKAPSVRFTALKFIIKISQKHPELKKEITFLTQDHYLDNLTPGIKRSVQKMIKEVKVN